VLPRDPANPDAGKEIDLCLQAVELWNESDYGFGEADAPVKHWAKQSVSRSYPPPQTTIASTEPAKVTVQGAVGGIRGEDGGADSPESRHGGRCARPTIFPRIRRAVVGQALRLPNQNTATDAVALQLQFNPRY